MQRREFALRSGDAKGEDGEWIERENADKAEVETGIGSFTRGGQRRPMAIEEYAVDWNGPATEPPPRLRLLLLADVDLDSAKRVVEWALQGEKAFDLCAVCGDFVPRTEGWSILSETEEELSAEEGEMSATLAQLENTVCRVVYVPGPLDPVMPSIRLSRSQRNKGDAAAAQKEPCLLQLTPTSKNLHRRNLRLAPGLSMAGFTEESLARFPASSFTVARNKERDGAGGHGGRDEFADDQTYSTVRSLCRSGSRNRNAGGSTNHPSFGGGGSAAAAAAAGKAAAPPPPSESLILMTRLGGAQRQRRRRCSRDTAAADEAQLKSLDELAKVGAMTWEPPHCARELVTAARLRHLWASQQAGGAAGATSATRTAATAAADGDDSGKDRGGAVEGGGGGGRGGILLHLCAGPGASRAVSEALSEGSGEEGREEQDPHCRSGGGFASPTPEQEQGAGAGREGRGLDAGASGVENGPSRKADGADAGSNGGSGGSEGIACEVGGCTAVALGSLREDGAYCVVELAMPTRRTIASSGWSVAGVQFGTVDGCDDDPDDAMKRLTRAEAGNFVVNYD
eukprot:g10566.t2